VSQQTRTLRQDADRPLPARGRAAQAQSHCRSGWRGRCGAGFEDPGRCASLPWPRWLSGAVSRMPVNGRSWGF